MVVGPAVGAGRGTRRPGVPRRAWNFGLARASGSSTVKCPAPGGTSLPLPASRTQPSATSSSAGSPDRQRHHVKVTEDICEVVITGPDADWLAAFTRQLVHDRLAACGHNISVVRSIYRWGGDIHDEAEARVALHTRRSLVPAITERADRDHPYDVPCVLALPVIDGNSNYITWVLEQTRSR
jgi:periplasmic divalent cation tolerance protein